MILIQQMLILFIFLLIGFYCGKRQVITDEAARSISWIIVNISNPAVIVNSAINSDKSLTNIKLLSVIGIAVIVFAFLILFAQVIPKILGITSQNLGIYKAMTIFSNIAFMGFPLLRVMYGNEALLFGAIFLLPFNFLLYTYGIRIISCKPDNKKEKLQIRKIVNIGVISCLIALILYKLNLRIPIVLSSSLQYLSDIASPLSMMLIGQSLIKFNFIELFLDIKLLIFTSIKLIVIPVIGIFLLKFWIVDSLILGVCYIMLATPVASMVVLLAQQYECDYSFVAKGVALSTILSVITIPLVSIIIRI